MSRRLKTDAERMSSCAPSAAPRAQVAAGLEADVLAEDVCARLVDRLGVFLDAMVRSHDISGIHAVEMGARCRARRRRWNRATPPARMRADDRMERDAFTGLHFHQCRQDRRSWYSSVSMLVGNRRNRRGSKASGFSLTRC